MPQADPANAHGVIAVKTPDGLLLLSAAPTKDGRQCSFIDFAADQLHTSTPLEEARRRASRSYRALSAGVPAGVQGRLSRLPRRFRSRRRFDASVLLTGRGPTCVGAPVARYRYCLGPGSRSACICLSGCWRRRKPVRLRAAARGELHSCDKSLFG
jgi:hypothetical protein